MRGHPFPQDAQDRAQEQSLGRRPTPPNLSAYLTTAAAAAGYQPLDTQLTSLAGLSYTGNASKVVRVNAGETDFELATVSGGGGGALTYISTVTVSVAAATATFSSLDLATDGNYIIRGAFTSASGSITDFRMYVNGDSTAGNYQTETERALGTTFACGTFDNKLADLNANAQLRLRIEMSQFNSGHPVADAYMQEYYSGPTIQMRRASWMRTSSSANVTSITLAASGNFTGVFKLFKVSP